MRFFLRSPLVLLLSFSLGNAFAQTGSFEWGEIGPTNFGGKVRDIAFDADGTLWIASPGGGVWRSFDGGNSWKVVAGFNKGANIRNKAASSIDIADDGTIYVGTGELAFNYNRFGAEQANLDFPFLNTEGEAYKGYAGLPGQGVFVSTNGGASFSNANATWPGGINFDVDGPLIAPWLSIQKVATNGNRVFVASLRGLFYSDDRLQSLTPATTTFGEQPNIDSVVIQDIEFGANGRVYVTAPNALFISDDNGASFPQRLRFESGLIPELGLDLASAPLRLEIAVSPSDPNTLYLVVVNGAGFSLGVWRSTDAAETWEQIGPKSTGLTFVDTYSPFWISGIYPDGEGQGRYACMMEVDPQDPLHLFLGGQQWYEYTPENGWSRNDTRPFFIFPGDPQYVPNNLHTMAFDPNNPNVVYMGSDRDFMKSTDGGKSWQTASRDLKLGYLVDGDLDVTGRITASLAGTGFVFRPAGASGTFALGFDFFGGSSGVSFANGRIQASVVNPQQTLYGTGAGLLFRSFDGGTTNERFIEVSPDSAFPPPFFGGPCATSGIDSLLVNYTSGNSLTNRPLAHRITPFVLDEVITAPNNVVIDTNGTEPNPRYVFMGTDLGVYQITNPFYTPGGGADSIIYANLISPCFTANNYGNITAIAVSGDTSHTLYVGTSFGRLFRITNAHRPDLPNFATNNFTEITPTDPDWPAAELSALFISDIAVDPNHPDTVFVTFAGYPDQGNIPMVWGTLDATAPTPTFFSQQGSPFSASPLPTAPVYTVLFNLARNPTDWRVAIGTEYGVYSALSLSDGFSDIEWQEQNTGTLSRVPVFELVTQRWQREAFSAPGSERVGFRLVERAEFPLVAFTFGRGAFGVNIENTLSRPADFGAQAPPAAWYNVYPNPSSDNFTVGFTLNHPSTVQLELRDLQGRMVQRTEYPQLAPSAHRLRVSTANLSNGIYLLQGTVNGGQPFATKIVVQH